MTKPFELGPTYEMDKRRALAEEFLGLVFKDWAPPIFVSDDATFYDIDSGIDDHAVVLRQLQEHYGVTVEEKHLHWKVFELLDYLERNRK